MAAMFLAGNCSAWEVFDSMGESLQGGLVFLGFLVLLTLGGWLEQEFAKLVPKGFGLRDLGEVLCNEAGHGISQEVSFAWDVLKRKAELLQGNCPIVDNGTSGVLLEEMFQGQVVPHDGDFCIFCVETQLVQ